MGDGVVGETFSPVVIPPTPPLDWLSTSRRRIRFMDDRKYRQHGYQDSDRPSNGERKEGQRPPRPSGPRTMQDPSGPRLPRLVQAVTASRCFNCAVALAPDTDFKGGSCPKCGVALHCCK